MTKKSLEKFVLTACMFMLFILFTVAVKSVDTTLIWGEEIGFSRVNLAVHQIIQTNETFDLLSDLCFGFSICLAIALVVVGVVQLVKRKSIKKVDKEILIAGVVLVLTAVVYLFFEFVIINYRPILVDGELEASYPSSHILFGMVINIISLGYLNKVIKAPKFKIPALAGVGAVTLLGVVFRVLSGVHWLTDIVGALLISLALVMLYFSCTELEFGAKKDLAKNEENKEENAIKDNN